MKKIKEMLEYGFLLIRFVFNYDYFHSVILKKKENLSEFFQIDLQVFNQNSTYEKQQAFDFTSSTIAAKEWNDADNCSGSNQNVNSSREKICTEQIIHKTAIGKCPYAQS